MIRRVDTKYICPSCNSKYFTRIEAEECMDTDRSFAEKTLPENKMFAEEAANNLYSHYKDHLTKGALRKLLSDFLNALQTENCIIEGGVISHPVFHSTEDVLDYGQKALFKNYRFELTEGKLREMLYNIMMWQQQNALSIKNGVISR